MKYDLLVHVDLPDEKRFGMALHNIVNYNKALTSETYTVTVLANAAAVQFLKSADNMHAQEVTDLAGQGVVFKACNNALNKFGIDPKELLPCVQVVPAGLVEIVDLQRAGFAYIKP